MGEGIEGAGSRTVLYVQVTQPQQASTQPRGKAGWSCRYLPAPGGGYDAFTCQPSNRSQSSAGFTIVPTRCSSPTCQVRRFTYPLSDLAGISVEFGCQLSDHELLDLPRSKMRGNANDLSLRTGGGARHVQMRSATLATSATLGVAHHPERVKILGIAVIGWNDSLPQ